MRPGTAHAPEDGLYAAVSDAYGTPRTRPIPARNRCSNALIRGALVMDIVTLLSPPAAFDVTVADTFTFDTAEEPLFGRSS